MLRSVRMSSVPGRGALIVRDFVFEEEYVDIPTSVIGFSENLIFDLVQDSSDQGNVREPPNQEIVLEE